MKKFFFSLVALVAVTATATAQNEAVWGVRAGYTSANLHASYAGMSANGSAHSTFHVGVAYQQPLFQSTPLYVETGLYFAGRGSRAAILGDDKEKINNYYIQLPVLISWHFNVGEKFSIQPYAGAYYGLGISGKLKGEGYEVNMFKKSTVDATEIPQLFKRSDVGLRFGVSFVLNKRYMIGASYDLGLTNIVKTTDGDGKIKNRAVNITLGYNF